MMEKLDDNYLEKGHSLWQDAWYRLSRNRAAMFGVFVVQRNSSTVDILHYLYVSH